MKDTLLQNKILPLLTTCSVGEYSSCFFPLSIICLVTHTLASCVFKASCLENNNTQTYTRETWLLVWKIRNEWGLLIGRNLEDKLNDKESKTYDPGTCFVGLRYFVFFRNFHFYAFYWLFSIFWINTTCSKFLFSSLQSQFSHRNVIF